MPLTPGTGERQLAFKLNELTDVQSLVDMMWQQLTGLSAASTESLRPMVRIGHRLYLLYVQHRADYAAALNAPPAYIAPTADVITGWKADDPQLKAAFEALSASIITRQNRDKCANSADRERSKRAELETANITLSRALIKAITGHQRLGHLVAQEYIKSDQRAFNVAEEIQLTQIYSGEKCLGHRLPSCGPLAINGNLRATSTRYPWYGPPGTDTLVWPTNVRYQPH